MLAVAPKGVTQPIQHHVPLYTDHCDNVIVSAAISRFPICKLPNQPVWETKEKENFNRPTLYHCIVFDKFVLVFSCITQQISKSNRKRCYSTTLAYLA